ncbi:MAG TPA: CBS domain-containing protein [Devosiaceae bacterium]|jgi:CBS domain-containing protein|nr:CBS domain-containing protein [Devosiaceae bacterium]
MQVDNILQSKGMTVHTVTTHAPISEAIRVLSANRIGAVVVINDSGKVAGILSERDIVRHLDDDAGKLLKRSVREVMTAEVITCGRDASVSELMEQMTRHRIRHIPVVEDDELVGIVSIGDVVKRKIEEAEQEAIALKEYIAS